MAPHTQPSRPPTRRTIPVRALSAAHAGGDDVQAGLAAARKNRELEEGRDILRKAARYFATETRW